ncbi:MAG: LD-carboxypeptidase [Chitinophagaceae bacterium]|nr:LD-carboxypeptidase [Chitinophagaceae bacterium]
MFFDDLCCVAHLYTCIYGDYAAKIRKCGQKFLYCRMAILPPYLKPGDTIGITCPAGFLPLEKAETCIKILQEWGFKVKVGKTLGSQFNYFSGTDEERLTDFQQMLNDDSVQAVLCGRGGYGVSRIIDHLDFTSFQKNPKWIIGFSDITVLHSHIYTKFNIASLHSPMAAAFNDEEYKNPFVQSMRTALTGEAADYSCSSHPYNKEGNITGELVGGNLSLLAHLTGSESSINTKNKILFMEDVGEYLYNVDRMLIQLQRSGQLENLKALIIGGFTDMKDTTTSFGQDIYDVLNDKVKNYHYPVCFNFPVSHEKENYALKIGQQYNLVITKEKTVLKELA